MRTPSTMRVQDFLDRYETGLHVIYPEGDTATVQSAAQTLGVEPGQIAKTLALRAGESRFLLVMSGDARLDNAKFRNRFGSKPRMLSAEEAEELTGQPVGGVGPFGHRDPVEVFCDGSLLKYDVIYPAAGSPASAVRVTPALLAELTTATWVDVARDTNGAGADN